MENHNQAAKNISIYFSKDFLASLDNYYPETDRKELKKYIGEKIYGAIKKLSCMDNGINVRKIIIGIDPFCTSPITIDIDRAFPKYDTAYLQVRTEIIESIPGNWSNNLIEAIK